MVPNATAVPGRKPAPAPPAGDGYVVAIDGPGGSGKSAVARSLARALGVGYLDTGASYRAVTWARLHLAELPQGLAQATPSALARWVVERLDLSTDPDQPQVALAGQEITAAIRSAAVTAAVSELSADPQTRQVLVAWQRGQILAAGSCVAEGRDIGAVVAPDALLKVWLTADPRVRAARRAAQLGGADVGGQVTQLAERDRQDASRDTDPMMPAEDAVALDTTELSLTQVVDRLLELVASRRAGR